MVVLKKKIVTQNDKLFDSFIQENKCKEILNYVQNCVVTTNGTWNIVITYWEANVTLYVLWQDKKY